MVTLEKLIALMAEQQILSTQVIIVGAGPTGLTLAAQLLRYGIDFIILEKNERTTHLSKAVVIQARTLEIFDEMGLAEEALHRGRLATAFNLYYQGEKKVIVDIAGLGKGLSKFPFALSLEQSKTETLLVDHLAGHQKNIRWKANFKRLEQTNVGVTAYYSDGDDDTEKTIAGLYLVGCDGASSPVRHQLGLAFEGDTIGHIFYVADVKINSSVVNKDELFVFLIKKGFILYFPMEGEKHYRLIGILPDKTEEDDAFTFDEIEAGVRADMAVPAAFEELHWFSTYKVHSRKAKAFMKGRCFIAGDAGHIHTPAGGQGMNTGIQDAYNLAWKLAYCIKGELKTSVLNSYDTEREQNARNLLSTTDRMFEFITGSNKLMNFMRLQIFPTIARFISRYTFFNKQIFPLLSQTGIAYPDSMLTIPGEVLEVKSGNRMPHFLLSDGKSVYDLLKAPKFKLLLLGDESRLLLSPLRQTKLDMEVINITEVPTKVFGRSEFFILLRPDNHISYIGDDIMACTTFIKNIAGESIATPAAAN